MSNLGVLEYMQYFEYLKETCYIFRNIRSKNMYHQNIVEEMAHSYRQIVQADKFVSIFC